MPNIVCIIDKLLRNHIYKIIVVHWIRYQPLFEQPGPDRLQYETTFIAEDLTFDWNQDPCYQPSHAT